MIHRRNHRYDRLSVAERQYADFRSGQELLNHHLAARRAEHPILHDAVQGIHRFCLILGDNDPFAERKPICFDDNRIFPPLLDIRNRRFRVGKDLVSRSRDAVFFHQIFGKHLASLDLCSRLIWAERPDTRRMQRIDHPEHQRVVRRDHHKIDALPLGKRHHSFDVGRLDRHTFRIRRDTAVTGRAVDFFCLRILFEFPDHRVFAAP